MGEADTMITPVQADEGCTAGNYGGCGEQPPETDRYKPAPPPPPADDKAPAPAPEPEKK